MALVEQTESNIFSELSMMTSLCWIGHILLHFMGNSSNRNLEKAILYCSGDPGWLRKILQLFFSQWIQGPLQHQESKKKPWGIYEANNKTATRGILDYIQGSLKQQLAEEITKQKITLHRVQDNSKLAVQLAISDWTLWTMW